MVNTKHIQLKIVLGGSIICRYVIKYFIFKAFSVRVPFIQIFPIRLVSDERLLVWAKVTKVVQQWM